MIKTASVLERGSGLVLVVRVDHGHGSVAAIACPTPSSLVFIPYANEEKRPIKLGEKHPIQADAASRNQIFKKSRKSPNKLNEIKWDTV